MVDKKPAGRGVVDSIYALRLRRFNEYGPGSARAKAGKNFEVLDATFREHGGTQSTKKTDDKIRALRARVAAITPKPKRPKKAKKGKSKRARS